MNMQNHYLSRNKARDLFGSYTSIPRVVLTTLNELFETEGQPRRVKVPLNKPAEEQVDALLFDRNPERPKLMLVKDVNRFGLFKVNDDLTLISGKEFLIGSDNNWRNPS